MIDEGALAAALRPKASVARGDGHGVGEAAVAYGSTHDASPPAPVNPRAHLDPLLTQIVGVIVRDFDPERIVLFGERVEGARRSDAEYKFVVVLDAVERRWERATEIRMAFSDVPVYAEVVVAPTAEIQGDVDGPVIDHAGWAVSEGVTLYDRGRARA